MEQETSTHGSHGTGDWLTPEPGQHVRLRHRQYGLVSGRLDMRSDDGSVIWIHLHNGGGRRLIHRDDGYQLEEGATSS